MKDLINDRAAWDAFLDTAAEATANLHVENPDAGGVIGRVLMRRHPLTHADFAPMFGLVFVDGDIDGGPAQEKFIAVMRAVSVAGQAVACVLTAGAWVARDRGQGQAVRPSMDPTRVEAVILSAEHVNFGPTLRLAEIITDADGRRCQPWRPSRGLLASVLVTAPSPETEATAQALLASLASRGLLNMTYVAPEKFN
jgi:hypothetical protein